ncbi:hypothetical protein, partial [Pseudomonas sp.]|uniref:hypothetical protein n=1 Tax=Pseudomonas sp. TaxID=306 RepID=UPI003BB09FC9
KSPTRLSESSDWVFFHIYLGFFEPDADLICRGGLSGVSVDSSILKAGDCKNIDFPSMKKPSDVLLK